MRRTLLLLWLGMWAISVMAQSFPDDARRFEERLLHYRAVRDSLASREMPDVRDSVAVVAFAAAQEPQSRRLAEGERAVRAAFLHLTRTHPAATVTPYLLSVQGQYAHFGMLHRLVGEYFEGSAQLDRARDAYARAVTLEPRYAETHLALGRVLVRLEQWEEALRAYERAVAADERRPDGYSPLINLHRRQGTLDALIRRLEIRARATPSNTALQDALREARHKREG